MRLIVTEKPSVARDLARILDPGARAQAGYLEGHDLWTWALGHLGELAPPETYEPRLAGRWRLDLLPVLPDRWEVEARPGPARRQLSVVRRLLRRADEVVVATDAGREGELIWAYIRRLAGYTGPERRLWLAETTPSAVRRAFAHLEPPHTALRTAAEARARADWLVGLNATMALSARHGGTWSAGRVQTPTLALLVTREREIRAFVPQPYWTVEALFAPRDAVPGGAQGGPPACYVGRWTGQAGTPDLPQADQVRGMDAGGEPAPGVAGEAADEAPHPPAAGRIPDADRARAVVARVRGRPGRVIAGSTRQERETPPRLMNLTDLQRACNARYGLTARQTLAAAQFLYERRLITYPRTDSRYLTPDVFATVPQRLRAVHAAMPDLVLPAQPLRAPGRRVVDASRVSDHHALLPTDEIPDLEVLTGAQRLVYELLARRLAAALLPDAVWAVTEVWTEVAQEASSVRDLFQSRSRRLVEAGWRAAEPPFASGRPDPDSRSGRAQAVPPFAKDRAASRKEDTQEPGGPLAEGGGCAWPAAGRDGADMELAARRSGEEVSTVDARTEEHATEPPPRYTDATLLRAMETAGRHVADPELRDAMAQNGLGTPATRAQMLETLIERGYVERQRRSLRPTEKGEALIERCPPALADPATTGAWERRLREVERGDSAADAFLHDIAAWTREIVHHVASQEPVTLDDMHAPGGARPTARTVETSRRAGRSVTQGGKHRTRPQAGAKAASGIHARAQTATVLLGDGGGHLGPCPLCGAPIVETARAYGCSRWRPDDGGCRFVVWKTVAGKRLTEHQVRELVERGETSRVLDGFRTRDGRRFAARLALDRATGRIAFASSGPGRAGLAQGAIRAGAGGTGTLSDGDMSENGVPSKEQLTATKGTPPATRTGPSRRGRTEAGRSGPEHMR